MAMSRQLISFPFSKNLVPDCLNMHLMCVKPKIMSNDDQEYTWISRSQNLNSCWWWLPYLKASLAQFWLKRHGYGIFHLFMTCVNPAVNHLIYLLFHFLSDTIRVLKSYVDTICRHMAQTHDFIMVRFRIWP